MRTSFHATAAVAAAAFLLVRPTHAQAPSAGATGIKYMRDSEEYAALSRQVYRQAAEAVGRRAQALAPGSWSVVLDVDETALDNSVYQLDRAAYGLAFESSSWNAWVLRREAGAVPGVADFVAAVRRLGGRVAWISNRDAIVGDATRANLRSAGLLGDDDRVCLQEAQRPKAVRRAELVSGKGSCAWSGTPVYVVAFIGDQMGDFPAADERIADTGTDDAFGRTCFLLPNSMYGDWATKVTRRR
jgi:5'-nucleotidase (lipoprotein e(P4) family)